MAPPDLPIDAPAQAALAWAHSARFLVTASRLHELPETGLPEIAFVGRSNSGKSSAINALARHKRLAFASKTPGRTQHINLFEVGPTDAADAIWVDLPGYGFAAVERESKKRWQAVVADYLAQRHNLTGLVMMVDARHGFTDLDRQLLGYVWPRLANGEVKLLVLLTKADKVNRRDAQRALVLAQRVLAEVATEHSDIGVTLFSALSGQGIDDVALALRGWAAAHSGATGADQGRPMISASPVMPRGA